MATSSTTLALEMRSASGTKSAKAARNNGLVPGVLYGHGAIPAPIAVDAKALDTVLHGHARELFEITLDGARDSAMIRGVERDPLTRRVISVDLQRVSGTESVTQNVPINAVGIASGVKNSGGVLDVVLHQVSIAGPANGMPERIDVDVTALERGHHITAGQLTLPAGCKMMTPHDSVVISIEGSRTGDAGAGAGPEQIAPENATGGPG